MAETKPQQEIRTDIPHPKNTLYTRCIKRVLDVVLSGIAILILSPVLLLLMLLELIIHGRPIFYMDKRPGKDGKIFEMYKFRSMLNETERNGKHLTPAERITPFGRFLRKTSLDELPGLFNVFNGTMSVIGPRPLMESYLPLYNRRHRYRHRVRPGLACWRIGGTDELDSKTWTWNDQFESDIYYVEHVSFWLDVKMILKTFKVLFSRSEMRTNSNRVKFDGSNLLETRSKKQILAERKGKALVLAGGIPQIELIMQLKRRDIVTVLADGNPAAVARPFSDIFYHVDIFDIQAVKDIAEKEQVDFVLTVCADQVLLVVAQVSEELGLPCYIDYKTAQDVSDKIKMKTIFRRIGVPTTDYITTDCLDEEAVSRLHFPLVVKPVDAYSSKGVRKAANLDELKHFYAEAHEISRSGGVIIEEFFDGEEISVDAFVSGGKARILAVTNSEKVKDKDRFVIFRGRYPAAVSKTVLRKIEEIAQKIAEGFGLVDSPLLIQLLHNGDEVSVLEFCARTGGGLKWLLIKYSCGVDVITATIDITLGQKPNLELKDASHKIVVNDFIYCRPGVFDHFEGFDEMLEEGLINDFRPVRAKGTVMRGVTSSSDRIAGMNIMADSIEEFNKKERTILEAVKVVDADGNDIMRKDLLPPLK